MLRDVLNAVTGVADVSRVGRARDPLEATENVPPAAGHEHQHLIAGCGRCVMVPVGDSSRKDLRSSMDRRRPRSRPCSRASKATAHLRVFRLGRSLPAPGLGPGARGSTRRFLAPAVLGRAMVAGGRKPAPAVPPWFRWGAPGGPGPVGPASSRCAQSSRASPTRHPGVSRGTPAEAPSNNNLCELFPATAQRRILKNIQPMTAPGCGRIHFCSQAIHSLFQAPPHLGGRGLDTRDLKTPPLPMGWRRRERGG